MSEAAREGAERFSWPSVAARVAEAYDEAIDVAAAAAPTTRAQSAALRLGLAPADGQPRAPAQRLPSPEKITNARRSGLWRIGR
jgi:hypothetical protein